MYYDSDWKEEHSGTNDNIWWYNFNRENLDPEFTELRKYFRSLTKEGI